MDIAYCMTAKADHPNTLAIRFLRAKRVPFHPHLYQYEEHGGTHHAAESLGASEHAVIKILVMEKNMQLILIKRKVDQ